MIRDAKEVRRCFEREKKKADAKLLQRKKGEIVDPRDIQVKQGLEIPMDETNQLPPAEQSSDEVEESAESVTLLKRSTIRTVIK